MKIAVLWTDNLCASFRADDPVTDAMEVDLTCSRSGWMDDTVMWPHVDDATVDGVLCPSCSGVELIMDRLRESCATACVSSLASCDWKEFPVLWSP